MASKPDVHEIYTVRALACLTIVLLHSLEAVANVRPELEHGAWTAMAVVLKFGTPVFVMVSAFVLAYSYGDRPTPDRLFRKRAAKLLPPFIIIGAFYAALSWYIDDLTPTEALWRFAGNMFLAGYHGYFILIILQFILIFSVFKRLAQAGPKRMIAGSAVINAAWLAFFNFVPAPDGEAWANVWGRVSWLPFPGWILFFTIAYYLGANITTTRTMIRERGLEITSSAAAAAALVAVLYLSGVLTVDSSKRVDMLVLAPLAFLAFFLIGTRKPGRIIMWVSANSFGIYLLHFFFIAVMDKALGLSPLPLPALVFAAVLFVSSTVLSGLTTLSVQRLPLGQYVVGPAAKPSAAPKHELAYKGR